VAGFLLECVAGFVGIRSPTADYVKKVEKRFDNGLRKPAEWFGGEPLSEAEADALVERSKTDAGAPFEAESLAGLRALRDLDQAAYEKLYHRLKKEAGVRVSEIEKTFKQREKGRGWATRDSRTFSVDGDGKVVPNDRRNRAIVFGLLKVEREFDAVRGEDRYLKGGKLAFVDRDGVSATDVLNIAIEGVEAMGHLPIDPLTSTKTWIEDIRRLPVAGTVDAIFDEMGERIGKGRARIKALDQKGRERAQPKNFLIMAFGLWDLPDGRSASTSNS
jgi:hypothetical protein